MSPSKPSNSDRDAALLAGDVAPLSRSAWADTANVIPFRPRTAALSWADEEADDPFESIGLLAVRIVGNFDRPRIHVEMSAPEGPSWEEAEDPPGL